MLLLLLIFILPVSSESVNDTTATQHEECKTLDELLKEELLNRNFDMIKEVYQTRPQEIDLCIPFTYHVECSDSCQEETIIWTKFNTSTYLGQFFYQYAANSIDLFGFELKSACNLNQVNILRIKISCPCHNLIESLTNLTAMVSFNSIVYFVITSISNPQRMHEGYSSQSCLSVSLCTSIPGQALMWRLHFQSQWCIDITLECGYRPDFI